MNTTSTRRRRSSGFTLVEILVVIGIMLILIGILVPMVGKAMRQAKQTRTAADMQSIATALEAFKNDTGDYPRLEAATPNTGAAILGRYLNGPLGDGFLPNSASATPDDSDDPKAYNGATEYLAGDVVTSGALTNTFVALKPNTGVATGTTTTWAPCNNLRDGLDGPGIRHGSGRKKLGPYVTGDKMKMQGIAFIDGNGNPILYFPARPGPSGNLTAANAYVNRTSAPAGRPTMLYDADDNFEAFRREGENDNTLHASPLHRIRAYLGDYDGDGTVETSAGEKIVTERPYLLWAAGTDGKFGPDADLASPPAALDVLDVDKCDDVVNFK